MVTYKLIYFNERARAEVIRYIFAQSDVKYEDMRYEIDLIEWNKDKHKMPFDQIPVLEVDGERICQTFAIARFLAKRYGLAGKSDLEAAKVDMIVGSVGDNSQFIVNMYLHVEAKQDEDKLNEMKKEYQDKFLPRFLENVETLLVANNGGNGYIVGDQLTWADLLLATHVTWPSLFDIPVPWDKAPKLKALCERVEALPKIAAWIKKRPQTKL